MPDSLFDSFCIAEQPRRKRLREAQKRLIERSSPAVAPDVLPLTANPPARPWKYWIQDENGTHALAPGINTIGRMRDNRIVLDDAHVSRHHCAIIVHGNGECEVHDIASKNGTILNGQVVSEPMPIRPGDVLNLSNHRIVLLATPAGVGEDTPMPAEG
jgi:hypothetical protein